MGGMALLLCLGVVVALRWVSLVIRVLVYDYSYLVLYLVMQSRSSYTVRIFFNRLLFYLVNC
jgi:hypothetical protein